MWRFEWKKIFVTVAVTATVTATMLTVVAPGQPKTASASDIRPMSPKGEDKPVDAKAQAEQKATALKAMVAKLAQELKDAEKTVAARTRARDAAVAALKAAEADRAPVSREIVQRERARTARVAGAIDRVTREAQAAAGKEVAAAPQRVKAAQEAATKAEQELSAAKAEGAAAKQRFDTAYKAAMDAASTAKTAITAAEDERDVSDRIKRTTSDLVKSAQEARPKDVAGDAGKAVSAVTKVIEDAAIREQSSADKSAMDRAEVAKKAVQSLESAKAELHQSVAAKSALEAKVTQAQSAVAKATASTAEKKADAELLTKVVGALIKNFEGAAAREKQTLEKPMTAKKDADLAALRAAARKAEQDRDAAIKSAKSIEAELVKATREAEAAKTNK